MKLYAINTGHFKLDGGAMFGVVPKSIWNKLNPADANNMCSWAMRSLLIEDGEKLILIDTGIGTKQSEKFFGFYFLHGDDSLDKSLAKHGFHRSDITDVVLTHLHFDHCGGAIQYNSSKDAFEPAFPNAKFWSNARHWKWATEPNPREKASFLKENIQPIKESGQLNFVTESNGWAKEVFPNLSLWFVDGHTDAQMLPHITYKGKTVVFTADLLPSAGHIPIPYVMGYDTRPLLTLTEKEHFLTQATANDYVLFFQHDPIHECGIVEQTERGFKIKETADLNSYFG